MDAQARDFLFFIFANGIDNFTATPVIFSVLSARVSLMSFDILGNISGKFCVYASDQRDCQVLIQTK